MNIAYFGSPEIAATVLKNLLKHTSIEVKVVVTQPDRPAGKKLQLQPTKVKDVAIKENLAIFDKDIKESITELKEILTKNEIELVVVYAYGAYIPKDLLDIPRYGCVNVHFSLLPKYRGASPIAYPLILGDTETGVTLFKLNNVLDAGEIVSQKKTNILEDERRTELEKRLTELSIPLTIEYIENLDKGVLGILQSQNEAEATHSRQLSKNDGYILLNTLQKALKNEPLSSEDIPSLIQEYTAQYPLQQIDSLNSGRIIYNYYRGLYDWPGIWTTIQTHGGAKRLKLTHLSFKENRLSINTVQIEGKNEVDFATFNKAYKIFNL